MRIARCQAIDPVLPAKNEMPSPATTTSGPGTMRLRWAGSCPRTTTRPSPITTLFFQDESGNVVHVGVVESVDPKTGDIHIVAAAGKKKGVVRQTLTHTKAGSAFGPQTIKGYGLWHNFDQGQTGNKTSSWWSSLWNYFFPPSPPSDPSKPNPEGHPQRHKTVPCLKNRDGSCAS